MCLLIHAEIKIKTMLVKGPQCFSSGITAVLNYAIDAWFVVESVYPISLIYYTCIKSSLPSGTEKLYQTRMSWLIRKQMSCWSPLTCLCESRSYVNISQ